MKHAWKRALTMAVSVAMLASAVPWMSPFQGQQVQAQTQAEPRNLAHRRAAYHSSAVTYDETAQLVTDGIYSMYGDRMVRKTSQYPASDSPLDERLENLFDGDTATKYLTFHNTCWVQVRLPEKNAAKGVASYRIASANDSEERDPKNWKLLGSMDGEDWTVLDEQSGILFDSREQEKDFPLKETVLYTHYRLDITEIRNPGATSADGQPLMQLAEWDLLDEGNETVLAQEDEDFGFNSVWKAEATQEQYVYVDLGETSQIESVKLFWPDDDYALAYDIQLSDDAESWRTVYTRENGAGQTEECAIPGEEQARYVRLLCRQSNGDVYTLSEMEVWGLNTLHYDIGDMPAPEEDGTQYLRGGNWRLERASQVEGTGESLSQAGYNDESWLPATVPGTVLTSYKNAGAVPDMGVADNILQISDSYFTTDFWYRNTFEIPKEQEGHRTWLNFNAINWKADVYFNGTRLGDIQGAFIRGQFDITELANYGGENYLAVYIHANDNPGTVDLKNKDYAGSNGGVLVLDNPTIAASIGWDWIPTIPGRNIGIYDDVFISYSEDVLIEDPMITTKLSDNNTKATLTVKALLSNPSDEPVNVTVNGRISPSDTAFSYQVTLPAHTVKQDYTLTDDLVVENPQLWWPNTYGDQPLYTATLSATDSDSGVVSDEMSFQFGIRELTYDDNGYQPADDLKNSKYPNSQGGPLSISCNGVHIILRGGNWGMSDANLAATAEEYDVKVRMHAEANFTMIRNWVGMTSNRAFYEACDKYGILIWNDFWLANPIDGPKPYVEGNSDPNDEDMFVANAEDTVYRIRRHTSLAVYCGRNEGPPPESLNTRLEALTEAQDGSRYYSAFSADNHLTGEGFVYSAQTPSYYFEEMTDRQAEKIMQIERGYPNIPAYESLMKMLTEEYAWPINDVWGIHDFCGPKNGYSAVNSDDYVAKMNSWYGSSDNLRDFARVAQMMNYEGMKAMYEGMYHVGREGLLMWMSQSAWPSMIWQTYDYYYDTNGGYFGLKKGTAPLSAYWPNTQDEDSSQILLRNYTGKDRTGLRVVLDIYDIDGKAIHHDEKTMDIATDTSVAALDIPELEDASDIRFIKTALYDGDELISDNFYWMNAVSAQNYQELNMMERVEVEKAVEVLPDSPEGNPRYAVTLTNTSDSPALTVRLKTLDDATGEQMLPVYYSDNYVSLMPGQSQTITLEIDHRFSDGSPRFELEGFNVVPTDLEPGEMISEPKLFLRSTVNNLYSDAVLEKTAAPEEIGRQGAYVQAAPDGSLAKVIGLKENDIVVKYNGSTVLGSVSLAELYDQTPDGETVILKVWRENRYIRITFVKDAANKLFTVPAQIEGENFSEVRGVEIRTETCGEGGLNLSNISNGDVAIYKDVNFAVQPEKIVIRAATEVEGGPTVTVRLDSADGPVLGSASITTGEWQVYHSYELPLENTQELTGRHDIYLCFTGSMNINWFAFTAPEPEEIPYGPDDPEEPGDKEALHALIAQVQATSLAGYTQASVETLQKALEDAQAVAADEGADASRISEAIRALQAALDGLAVVYGDIDADGAVQSADALMVLQAATHKITLEPGQQLAANVDGQGDVSSSDALTILQRATQKIQQFPVEGTE